MHAGRLFSVWHSLAPCIPFMHVGRNFDPAMYIHSFTTQSLDSLKIDILHSSHAHAHIELDVRTRVSGKIQPCLSMFWGHYVHTFATFYFCSFMLYPRHCFILFSYVVLFMLMSILLCFFSNLMFLIFFISHNIGNIFMFVEDGRRCYWCYALFNGVMLWTMGNSMGMVKVVNLVNSINVFTL